MVPEREDRQRGVEARIPARSRQADVRGRHRGDADARRQPRLYGEPSGRPVLPRCHDRQAGLGQALSKGFRREAPAVGLCGIAHGGGKSPAARGRRERRLDRGARQGDRRDGVEKRERRGGLRLARGGDDRGQADGRDVQGRARGGIGPGRTRAVAHAVEDELRRERRHADGFGRQDFRLVRLRLGRRAF